MKILHLETGRHLYGGAQQVVYLLSGLAQDPGVYNILVCPPKSGVWQQGSCFADETYTLPMHGDLDPVFLGRLVMLLRRIRPDVVHIHSRRGADIWGAMAARCVGAKTILTRRVDNPEPTWLIKHKYRLYDRVITISKGISHVLRSQGVPEDTMTCIPSAVHSTFSEHPCCREWFLQEFRLPDEALTLGVVAQFIKRKGHDYLLEALPEIIQTFPEVKVLFFGQGPLEHSLRQTVSRYGLKDTVTFAGFRRDLETILPCLRIIVHPATMEGLGVCLLQAASAGVPIVAFASGGIPEIVHHEDNGLLVAPGESHSLAVAIRTILGNPDLARKMGRNGQRLVRQRFSIEAMVKKNTSVYRQVLGIDG